MSWDSFAVYVGLAVIVILVPGPDFALVLKNSLLGGPRGGLATSLGITTSNLVQGSAAALGLGALIAASQPAFTALRWAGVAYLCYLGVQALRSAWIGGAHTTSGEPTSRRSHGWSWRRYRQGFVSNITNPKVLTLYLSILPQFLGSSPSVADAMVLAYTHAVLGLAWLLVLVVFLHQIRTVIRREPVRRTLDAVTGCVLLGFGVRLATESS